MISRELEVASQAARQAGQLLQEMQVRITVREKAAADLVTEADVAAQELIRGALSDHFPADSFVGEEDEPETSLLTRLNQLPRCWIVDPLDGTTNFVHGLENFGVSIALAQFGQVECGVVFDPVRNELFAAQRGHGAWLNGRPLQTSSIERLEQALVAASLPARVARNAPELAQFVEVLFHAQAVRRLGSAALNLCYVGKGSIDAYWASSVKAWDVAAGLLVVAEAGGVTTNMAGQPINLQQPHLVAAATRSLHDELRQVLSRV